MTQSRRKETVNITAERNITEHNQQTQKLALWEDQ
jgi:hypothetical protein